MSYELIKGMTYQNGKVYTRQCSNNIIPKTYFREEHLGFTKQYNELGQVGFEKWFIINCLMTGSYKVQNGSNNILRRLNYFSNLLWKDKEYLKLYNCQNEKFDKTLSAKTPEEKEIANKEYKKSMEDIEEYISFFYDSHNSRYRNIEMER